MNATVFVAQANGNLAPCELQCVVSALRAGEPGALPTETVYGLAACALDSEACSRIFAAKERPFSDPLICHIPDTNWLDQIAFPNSLALELADAFWPGPLTLVLKKKPLIPDLVTAGTPTVAIRFSAHPVFQQIVKAFGAPLAAPSANRFGRISPTSAAHVQKELGTRIAWIVDGGECAHGLESTIVAVEENALTILRPGPILPEQLQHFAPLREASTDAIGPGRLPSHYAPVTRLHLLAEGERIPTTDGSVRKGLLAWQGKVTADWTVVEWLSPTQNLREAGQNFYAALRRLDEAQLDVIYAESLPLEGLGITIMERLRKAAFRV